MPNTDNNKPMEPKCAFQVQALIDNGRITREEIIVLEDKLQDVNVPPLTDEQIALFLLSCDRDLDFTIRTIKEFFKARLSGPELFDERCLEREDLQYQLNVIRYSIFPKRTPDNCAILFHRLQDFSSSHYHMEQSMKLLFMTLDSAVFDYPPKGLVILFDMQGVGLMHLTRIKMSAIKKFAYYLQDGLPVKLKQIHVVNTQYFIDKVMMILKPFIRKELYNQIHFHPPTDDMSKFHKEVIPKSCLPSDFQGDLPSVDELHEMNTKKLEEMRPYFDAEQKQRHDFYACRKKTII